MIARTQDLGEDALLTEDEAADSLRISFRTLQAWRLKAVGPPFVRVGRTIRYRRGCIKAWIKLNTCGASNA
ncbi:MAG: helix-turn-helix domain-containing protein [Pseudomonadota bacterium]